MLKVLTLNKRKNLKLEELTSLREKRMGFQAELDALETRVDSVATEAELRDIESSIDEAARVLTEHDEAISILEKEVETIEGEIKNEEEAQDRATKAAAEKRSGGKSEGGNFVGEINLRVKTPVEKRERMRQVLDIPECREFYEKLRDIIELRAVNNTDLLIPEIVMDMIDIDMLDVGNIYRLVTVRRIPGTARIILSGDTPAAVWLDMCGDLSELSLDFSMLEIDGFKIGGFIPICNATLEDSFINLAVHIQDQLAKSIVVGVEKAIVIGGGAAKKQPAGIIPSLPAANKVSAASDFASVTAKFGLLPDDAGDLTALMTRKTYYTHFAGQTIATTSSGQVVSQNTRGSVSLPDGTPVVFTKNTNITDGTVLIGDFKKFFLAQRAGLSLAKSEHVRFIQDQTVFKGTARYDGKPIKNDYWILLTLTKPKP